MAAQPQIQSFQETAIKSIADDLLQQHPEPILCISLNGDIIFQNKAASDIDEISFNHQLFTPTDFWKYFVQSVFKDATEKKIEININLKLYNFYCRLSADKQNIDVFGKDVTTEKSALKNATKANRRLKFATGPSGNLWEYNLQTKNIYYPLIDKNITGFVVKEAPRNFQQLLQIVHPADLKKLMQVNDAYISGQIVSHVEEYRLRTKDNTYRWVKNRGELISRTSDGKPQTVIGIILDISRRKDVEKISYETERRWRLALDGSGNGVWEYDHEKKEFYTSEICKKILNIKDKPATSGWRSLIHQDDLPLLIKINRDYLNGKIASHNIEYRIIQPDGTYKWIQDKGTLVRKADDGSPIKFTGLMCDVSERKQAEQTLKLSEEKYRSIIEDMNLGLLEVDNSNCIVYVNQSFCFMSGYSYDELKGKKTSELSLYNQYPSKTITQIGAIEIPVYNRNGEQKWWLISSSSLYDSKQNETGKIAIHLDITHQKITEQNLIEAKLIAEQSAKAKDVFIANMSHEIRTPMNAISGLSNLLKKTTLMPAQQSYVSSIQTATNNLLIIINDLLDLSKIDAGKMVLENIGFDLSGLLDDALKYIAYRAEEKDLKLIYKGDKNLHNILIGDPYKINQVLTNLLSNAVKFTNTGAITLSCKVVTDKANRQLIKISVQDTGIGMDEDFQKQLFTKFTQEDESITRRYGGSGLGMNIIKQLVDLMNGTIHIKSKKNEGTLVSVELKLAKGTEKDIPKKEHLLAAETTLENIQILVVEDNDINRLVATTILKEYDALIDEATDGKIAVEKVSHNDYDIILMDIRMPEMDGFEATQLIRKNGNNEVPVIALTAHAVKDEAEKCYAAGMNDFLVKPYQETDLIRIILKWLQKTDNTKNSCYKRANGKLYDLEQLKEISNNSKTFMAKMLDLFIESMPVNIQKMEQALLNDDMLTLKNVAHTVKPVIDNMNVTSLKDVIRRIEDIAASGLKTKELEELLETFKSCMNLVMDGLAKDRVDYE